MYPLPLCSTSTCFRPFFFTMTEYLRQANCIEKRVYLAHFWRQKVQTLWHRLWQGLSLVTSRQMTKQKHIWKDRLHQTLEARDRERSATISKDMVMINLGIFLLSPSPVRISACRTKLQHGPKPNHLPEGSEAAGFIDIGNQCLKICRLFPALPFKKLASCSPKTTVSSAI